MSVVLTGVPPPPVPDVDPERLRRIVSLILAHVCSGDVTPREIASVLRLAHVTDLATARLVRLALADRAVRIVAAPPAVAPERTVDPPHPAPRPFEGLQEAVAAATLVLERDRIHGRPAARVLTAEAELGLAYLMRDASIPLDQELPRRYRAGLPANDLRARAFDAMILHNTRLVTSVVAPMHRGLLEHADLEQGAIVGLIRAVEKFDATKGWKFSTYATQWIRQAAQRAVADEGQLIRLPVHVHEKVRQVRAARSPAMTDISNPDVIAAISASTGLSSADTARYLRLSTSVFSLDVLVGDMGDTTLSELLPAEQDPIDRWEVEHLVTAVRDAVSKLTDRQAMVIRLRTGMGGREPMTLDQIGTELGVTRERIRQIESKAKVALQDLLREAHL